ncbi:ABC transporter permease [Pseudomonas gingeri]|uniref:ABC transporter permease n=1 Tax=Pseudomonas gingeri TaxID=117681 RepID=A0A7Y7XBL7_9PSED|nr:ABC transporter permease [Pseudomonas gingeri]NWB95742.1 ABC transporter permease [Pseudomonas gingeri]
MKIFTYSRSAVVRILLLLCLIVFFSYANPDFLAKDNLYALGQGFALLGLVTLGLSLTMIAGEFDLSIGAIVAVAGLIMVKTGDVMPLQGLALAIGCGLLLGLLNGALTLWLAVSSLVTSLGMMILLRGLAVWIEGGQVVSYSNFDASDALDQQVLGILSPRSLITITCFVGIAVLLRLTRLGRNIIATGSRRKAALASGVNVKRSIYLVFALSGGFAALVGALMSISLASASSQYGSNLLLQAATAAILGGVALSGGVGRPLHIAVGVMILGVLNNGLNLLGTHSALILLFNGLMLLLVMVFDRDVGSFFGKISFKTRKFPG